MKKSLFIVPCIAAMLVFSTTTAVQAGEASGELTVAGIIAEPAEQYGQPFGYVPYPAVDGMPAYGVPYSYPVRGRQARQQRRMFSRLAPPPHQAYPLPAPGVMPAGHGVQPVDPPPHVAPPFVMGQMPQQQEMIGNLPAVAPPPGQPSVFFRPTPVRNFMALIVAPRPYIGYDPYAAYPPYPGYVPAR